MTLANARGWTIARFGCVLKWGTRQNGVFSFDFPSNHQQNGYPEKKSRQFACKAPHTPAFSFGSYDFTEPWKFSFRGKGSPSRRSEFWAASLAQWTPCHIASYPMTPAKTMRISGEAAVSSLHYLQWVCLFWNWYPPLWLVLKEKQPDNRSRVVFTWCCPFAFP